MKKEAISMIEVKHITKRFGDIQAVKDVTLTIQDGCIFGLVGTNGAGKSTLLRILAGVLKADQGSALIDGQNVYENIEVKRNLFYIPEDAYFFVNATPFQMMEYYAALYPKFDKAYFLTLLEKFHLDKNRKIQTFSKGMKKQVSILLGLSSNVKYLFCDETFDGLDPVMRQVVKSLFADAVIHRNLTPIIASHNLRELEDICDHVGLLHEGGVLLSEDLEDMKFHIHKLQCVMPNEIMEQHLLKELNVLSYERSGTLMFIIARGTKVEILNTVDRYAPVFREIIPLSLEEIFISETEVAGYEIKNILF